MIDAMIDAMIAADSFSRSTRAFMIVFFRWL
jgi:hypothetical protein